MSFENPSAAIWALLAIPIVLLYIGWLGRRRMVVSSHLIWRRALRRRAAWTIWERPFSLLMQLLMLAILILALMQPFLTGDADNAQRTVLIIDTSASMQATDVKPSRLVAARLLAAEQIENIGQYEEIAIISAGGGATVHCGLTDDKDVLGRALASVTATDGWGQMPRAIEAARQMTKHQRNPRIIVFGDGRFVGSDELAKAKDLQWKIVGKEAPNVALSHLIARRNPVRPNEVEASIVITNLGTTETEYSFEKLGFVDAIQEQLTGKLAAGKHQRHHLTFEAPKGGILLAQLKEADSLAADNALSVLISPSQTRRVTLLTDGNPRLEAMLDELPGFELRVVKTLPSDTSSDAAVILDRLVPNKLPNAPIFSLDPSKSSEFWDLTRGTANTKVVSSHLDTTTLFEGVDLSGVVFEAPHPLQSRMPSRTLASTLRGKPVLTLIEASHPVLVMHGNTTKSDLLLRNDWPRLIVNSVHWLAASETVPSESWSTRDSLQITGSDVEREIRQPTGDNLPLPISATAIGPMWRTGVWSVSSNQGKSVEAAIPVGLLSETESKLGEPPQAPEVVSAVADNRFGPLWAVLVGIGAMIVALEWILYHRKWTA